MKTAIETIRVVLADDSEDVRFLLRMQFSRDDRFDVVGEATDGIEAANIANELQPDLLILDQEMPACTGIEAIAEIKRASPRTSVILYTAHSDRALYQAAFDAGAIEVLEKIAIGRGFVDQLVGLLHDHENTLEIRVGPVSSAAAQVWIANSRRILDAAASHPEIVGFTIPDDLVELFVSFFDQWDAVAASSNEFRWVARALPSDIERIVGQWGAIDAMTDEQLDRLGVTWSPLEGAPFFEALTSGTLEALHRHEGTMRLAERLGEQWGTYVKR